MDVMTCRWISLMWGGVTAILVLFGSAHGQSCGPRVSARLLAEIPCDMSKSSYCSAPGSAYPWNSVKRYINDNQGLVRRMYGDEKHSSVLLNEIDGFKLRFEMLRNTFDGYRSRTVYGRSARGHKPTRRQPRPQLFKDDPDIFDVTSPTSEGTPEEPATIFRVVTETSIKVGEAVTKSMTTQETNSVSYEPAAEFDNYASSTPMVEGDTTTQATSVDTTKTETTLPYSNPTTETITTTETMSSVSSVETSTMPTVPDVPVAMQRVGYEDFEEEYEFEPRRKIDSSAMQNSVEEKTRYKDEVDLDEKRQDPVKVNDRRPYDDDLIAEESAEDLQEKNVTEAKEEEEAEAEEEDVPRRGINACPVKNEVIAPYWANNTRGETLALLNVHPFEQYVHFEKCAFENVQMLCREGCRCEQQYRLHRLLAFDPKNECRGIFSDWFRFPSCCVCICYDLTPDMPRTRSRKGRIER